MTTREENSFERELARNRDRARRALEQFHGNDPRLLATAETVRGYLRDPRLTKLTADLADARDGTFSYVFFLEAVSALEAAATRGPDSPGETPR